MTNKTKAAIEPDQIREILISTHSGGMCTEDLAYVLKISHRQVGGIMANLTKQGLVRRYPRGYIIFTSSDGHPAPCYLNNSYYEWIGQ